MAPLNNMNWTRVAPCRKILEVKKRTITDRFGGLTTPHVADAHDHLEWTLYESRHHLKTLNKAIET